MTAVPLGVPSLVRLRATMSIPDAALDVLPIAVAENWTVVYVSVSVINLRHDTAGDVRLSLRSPSKPDPVFLLNNNCGFSNFESNDEPVTPLSQGGTFTFSDAAPAPVSAVCGYPVRAGAYKPASPDAASADAGTLGLLAGAPAAGDWFFTFEDRSSGGVGFFDELQLTLTGAGPGESVTYTIPETSAVVQLPSIGTLYLDAAGSASTEATVPGEPVVVGVVNPGVNYWYTSGPTARVGDADDFPYKAIVAGREQNWTVQQVITLFGAPPPAQPPAAPTPSPPPGAPPAPFPPAPTPPAPPTPRAANASPAPPAAPALPAPPAAAPCVAGTGIQPVQLDPSSPAFASRSAVTVVLGAPPTKIWLWGPFAIPDGGADAITWSVAEGFTVSGVTLRIDGLRHAYASDLVLTLTNPAGVVTYLFNTACGASRVGSADARVTSGSIGEDFVFADADAAAANPTIASACADPLHGGVYSPGLSAPGAAGAGSMASLAGAVATGTWRLRFSDVAVKDLGFFDWASLTLTGTRGEAVIYDMPLRYTLAALPAGSLALPGGAPAAVGPQYIGNYLMYTPSASATDASGDSFAYSVLFGCTPAVAATQAIVVSVPAPPAPAAAPLRTLRTDAVQPAVLSHSAAYTNYVALHQTSPVDAACVLVLPEGIDDDIPLTVPDDFIVAGVALTLPDICHSSSQSLTVSLRAPPNADGSVDEVFLMNGNCPDFHLGEPNELTDGCLGEPLTFVDSAPATLEGVCTGGALGGPPDRALPLPGGFFKPTVASARGSVDAGSMALLAGRPAAGTWVLRVINAEGGLANFSCPLLMLTDTDAAVHTYSPSVSVQILLEPSSGLLYAQSELQRVSAVMGGASSSGSASRRLLQATLNAPPAPSAVPNAVGAGDLLDELRLFYRPHESTSADAVDVYTYRFVYAGRAMLRNITQSKWRESLPCVHFRAAAMPCSSLTRLPLLPRHNSHPDV
jgi:subtilisin-like proprotein convertase family protein